jgi:flagellar basal-body rod modification protein FlgD
MTTVSSVGSNTATSATTQDSTKLGQDFNQFLTLLTTQLQNQDPLSPMDSTQFTNQLVAFSGVEQQIKGNQLLTSLLSSQTLNMTALGVSFIGKNVEVAGKEFQAKAGASTTLTYEMPSKAETGTISITDDKGVVVYSANAELSAGVHSFTWNGKDKNGQAVPAGKYTIKVGAIDAEKTALNVSTYVPGYVSSLETANDGSLVLDVSGTKVPLSDVRKISAADA